MSVRRMKFINVATTFTRRGRHAWTQVLRLGICGALLGAFAMAQDADIPVARPVTKAAALPTPARDNEIAHWLAGLPTENGTLQSFALVAAWNHHAKELAAAWNGSERNRMAKVRAWAPDALGAVNASDSPVFYFFSGADFLYPHALFPNAKTYVLCAREPVGTQPDPSRIPPGELSGALADFRKSVDALLGLSFFITKDLRKEVTQHNIPGILPVLEMLLALEGAAVSEVKTVHCNDAGEFTDEPKPKGGSPGVRIRFRIADRPEQTLYYFYGDISNDGLKTHGGLLRFCETLGPGRSLLKAASYLPHENAFSRINEWILTHSTAIVQDPSGIPLRGFPKGEWTFRFWGRETNPIKSFAKYAEPALREAVAAAPAEKIPFGFGYQHEASNSLLILAERKK